MSLTETEDSAWHTWQTDAGRRLPAVGHVTSDGSPGLLAQLDISRGRWDGVSQLYKFGRNPDVGTGAYEDTWYYGGNYNWLQAASAVRVQAGGSANDTAAGSGAQTIRIEGLDETWAAATEDITLAGASASAATTTTFIRVHRAYVLTCGTYGGSNDADIVIETTGGTVVAAMAAGLGQTQLALYTVPGSTTLYLTTFRVEVGGSARNATLQLLFRPNADVTSGGMGPTRLLYTVDSLDNGSSIFVTGQSWPAIPARTDVWVRSISGSQAGPVVASFDGFLVTDAA